MCRAGASLRVFQLYVLPLLDNDGASWGWGARLDVTAVSVPSGQVLHICATLSL